MLVVTTPTVAGREIAETLGMVSMARAAAC
jgi:uncharacterized protein YbjQ (UPF0145 family)